MRYGGTAMKIICSNQHLHQLKSLLRDYLHLDTVIVEKGYEYEGLCYYFSMNHLDDLLMYFQSMENQYILCYDEDKLCKILPSQIVYIEGYSKEAFIYTDHHHYLTHTKLYELEERLTNHSLIRVNKSTIVNIHFIDYLIPDIHRRYIIVFKNKKRILLTRNYAKTFIEKLRRQAL